MNLEYPILSTGNKSAGYVNPSVFTYPDMESAPPKEPLYQLRLSTSGDLIMVPANTSISHKKYRSCF